MPSSGHFLGMKSCTTWTSVSDFFYLAKHLHTKVCIPSCLAVEFSTWQTWWSAKEWTDFLKNMNPISLKCVNPITFFYCFTRRDAVCVELIFKTQPGRGQFFLNFDSTQSPDVPWLLAQGFLGSFLSKHSHGNIRCIGCSFSKPTVDSTLFKIFSKTFYFYTKNQTQSLTLASRCCTTELNPWPQTFLLVHGLSLLFPTT